MKKELYVRYIEKLKGMKDREYIKTLLKYHLAPTTYGYKPAAIITLGQYDGRPQHKIWNDFKKDFNKEFMLQYIELTEKRDSTSIMFYNREKLRKAVFDNKNMDYLKEFSYNKDMSIEKVLEHLKERFQGQCPHEVGIFLGIPLEDVIVFSLTPEKQSLLSGYWKVYHNVEAAEEIFSQYDYAKESTIKEIICSS
jgi:hypothetical protein